jgi:hypothetical protein
VKLSSAGVLSGTPTKVGTYAFSVAVTDAGGRPASVSYALLVTRYIRFSVSRVPWIYSFGASVPRGG